MPAYLVGMMDITDPETFVLYGQAAKRALEPYEGRFRRLASTRETAPTVYEGEAPASYMFIFEFESREVFEEFYHSEAYQEALAIRRRATTTKAVMVMEGL